MLFYVGISSTAAGEFRAGVRSWAVDPHERKQTKLRDSDQPGISDHGQSSATDKNALGRKTRGVFFSYQLLNAADFCGTI